MITIAYSTLLGDTDEYLAGCKLQIKYIRYVMSLKILLYQSHSYL